jgi:hypothetical protein
MRRIVGSTGSPRPVFLGQGHPLIDGLPRSAGLDLASVMSYPSRNVMLRYCSGCQH